MLDLNENYLKENQTKLKAAKIEHEKRKEQHIMSLFSLDLNYRQELENRKLAKEKEIRDKHNMTIDEYFNSLTETLKNKKILLETYRLKLRDYHEKVNKENHVIWTLTNCLFVVGCMIGSFLSKFSLGFIGTKNSIIFHNIFCINAGMLVISSKYNMSPVCLLVSRFLFGFQGGIQFMLILMIK